MSAPAFILGAFFEAVRDILGAIWRMDWRYYAFALLMVVLAIGGSLIMGGLR